MGSKSPANIFGTQKVAEVGPKQWTSMIFRDCCVVCLQQTCRRNDERWGLAFGTSLL